MRAFDRHIAGDCSQCHLLHSWTLLDRLIDSLVETFRVWASILNLFVLKLRCKKIQFDCRHAETTWRVKIDLLKL
jgi:hypothetical protein